MKIKNKGVKCSIEVCQRGAKTKGFCHSHYISHWRDSDTKRRTKYLSNEYRKTEGGPCESCGKSGVDKWYSKLCYRCYAQKNYRRNKDKRAEYSRVYSNTYSSTPKGRHVILKSQAKFKNLICTLTIEEYVILLASNCCDYCTGSLPPRGTALDRLDNSKGYIPGNVVPCCKHCNRFRGERMTYEETKKMISYLRELRDKQGSPWE